MDQNMQEKTTTTKLAPPIKITITLLLRELL